MKYIEIVKLKSVSYKFIKKTTETSTAKSPSFLWERLFTLLETIKRDLHLWGD